MGQDRNKGYASVRIREETLSKLQRVRDKLRERELKERAKLGLPAPRHELSVNGVIEWLLYREAKEAARQQAYKQRSKA